MAGNPSPQCTENMGLFREWNITHVWLIDWVDQDPF